MWLLLWYDFSAVIIDVIAVAVVAAVLVGQSHGVCQPDMALHMQAAGLTRQRAPRHCPPGRWQEGQAGATA